MPEIKTMTFSFRYLSILREGKVTGKQGCRRSAGQDGTQGLDLRQLKSRLNVAIYSSTYMQGPAPHTLEQEARPRSRRWIRAASKRVILPLSR